MKTMRLFIAVLPVLAASFCLGPAGARAQPAQPDPDWPCQQRLVARLVSGSYWNGAKIDDSDHSWNDDPALSAAVMQASDRDLSDDEAVTAAKAWLATQPAAQRAKASARLFGAVLDQVNDDRNQVISRLDSLARRQRNLDGLVSSENKQIAAIPENATGAAGQLRTDLSGERDLNLRSFQDAQHTIRYGCEVPGNYERRLGALARALQG